MNERFFLKEKGENMYKKNTFGHKQPKTWLTKEEYNKFFDDFISI